jgi:hypothetical protein
MTRIKPKGDIEAEGKMLEDVVLGVERALKLQNIVIGDEEKAEIVGRLFGLMLRGENGVLDQCTTIVETVIHNERRRESNL